MFTGGPYGPGFEQADALLVLADPMFFQQRAILANLAAKNRLPAMYPNSEYVETGGLMSYAADIVAMFHRSAIYVDKILKGANPGDLPVEHRLHERAQEPAPVPYWRRHRGRARPRRARSEQCTS